MAREKSDVQQRRIEPLESEAAAKWPETESDEGFGDGPNIGTPHISTLVP